MQKEKFWVLIGMMGTGKSSIGLEMSRILYCPFVDTDFLLEDKFNLTIAQYIMKYGMEVFRERETQLLSRMTPKRGILSTGGGIVTVEQNWNYLRKLGTIIFLDSNPELIKQRLIKTKRKRAFMFQENWLETFDNLYKERRETYLKADLVVEIPEVDLKEAAQFTLTQIEHFESLHSSA